MSLRPRTSEERWLSLARELRRGPRTDAFAGRTGGWRDANLPSRCGFFALGILAAAMIVLISIQTGPANNFVLGGLLCIGAAEFLIVERRYFWSGIEEALEVIGFTLLALQCWDWLGWSHAAGAGFCAIAFTFTAWRLLNPLFAVAAALSFVWALDASHMQSGLACHAVAIVALAAGARTFRRPSYDHMLDLLVVVMPVGGYLWSEHSGGWSGGTDYRHATPSEWLVPLCPLAFAMLGFLTGIQRRSHAPLLAGMLCVACGAYELRKLTGLSFEARLITWGSVLLVACAFFERYLRIPRRGITSRQLHDETVTAGLLRTAGAAVIAPHAAPAKASPSFEGHGGGFSGGGAGGKY